MARSIMAMIVLLALVLFGCATTGDSGSETQSTTTSVWTDVTITMSVKQTLSDDVWVNSRKIDVDTVQGRVTLSGVVNDTEEAQRAVKLAKRIRGVRSVRNNLQTGKKTIGQSLDDSVILSQIKSQLLGEPNVRSLKVDVDVIRGVATLTGLIDGFTQKMRILEIAQKTPGVVKVIDNLQVK